MPSFTVYLIKENYIHEERYKVDGGIVRENRNSIFNDGVTISDNYNIHKYIIDKEIEVRKINKSKAILNIYYRETDNYNPWWKNFWNIPEALQNKSVDLIIIIEIKNRIFIVTHGQGRFLINPLSIVYDFGLKTALNLLDENKIKTADLFTPSVVGMRTKKQTGISTKFDEYEINIFNSLLKNIAGSVKDIYGEYFNNINGSDSIKFNFKGNIDDLLDRITLLYENYNLDYYKKNFEWIDNFRIIKDKGLIAELDSILVAEINNRNTDIVLSFQDITDETISIYYRYLGIDRKYSSGIYPSLDIRQYYEMLNKLNKTIELENLKNQQIFSVNSHNNQNLISKKIYQCLYCDIDYEGMKYFIESGVWYKVDKNFLLDIDLNIKSIIDNSRVFDINYNILSISDEAKKRKVNNEYVFNEKLVNRLSSNNVTELLDTKIIIYKKNQIEACDVISLDNNNILLIHSKYKHGSNSLSHLFSQGYVSAELLTDKNFRELVNKKITNNRLFFSTSEYFDRNKYIVIFCIISKKNKSGEFNLPLFSKINLDMFYRNLILLDYRVELTFIEAT